MATYEEAIQAWGRKRLKERYGSTYVDHGKVTVDFDFDEGYACCGGSDPNCYCSFAESPSASIKIQQGTYTDEISHYSFDFAQILSELVEAADGIITGEKEER